MMTRRGFLTRLAGVVIALRAGALRRYPQWVDALRRYPRLFSGITPAQVQAVTAPNLTLFNPSDNGLSFHPKAFEMAMAPLEMPPDYAQAMRYDLARRDSIMEAE